MKLIKCTLWFWKVIFRSSPRGGFKSQILNRLNAEESSSCPVLFSTVRISRGSTEFVSSNHLLRGEPLEPTSTQTQQTKVTCAFQSPPTFPILLASTIYTEWLDSSQNSPTYTHSDLAYGFCSPKKNFPFKDLSFLQFPQGLFFRYNKGLPVHSRCPERELRI